jgi:hypothetical protein
MFRGGGSRAFSNGSLHKLTHAVKNALQRQTGAWYEAC